MIGGSVQISGEELSSPEVRDICDSMKQDSIRLLSLRGCRLDDKDFHRLMKAFAQCRSIVQLNLNLGVVSDQNRVTLLADALNSNRSLESLLLHGTGLGDAGLGLLIKAFCQHPSLVCLDLGDCALTDTGIRLLVNLLPPDGAKKGLEELTLSANTSVTDIGWSHLFCAISASSQLKVLNLDYNNIGDYVAGIFAVAMSGSRTLHTVDFEGCGITNKGATIILEMLESFPTPLRDLILAGNQVSSGLQQDIEDCLRHEDDIPAEIQPRPASDKGNWKHQSSRSILPGRAHTTHLPVNTDPAIF